MSEIASAAVKNVWDVVRSVIYDKVKTYVGYVQDYELNLNTLSEELEKLCLEKKDVDVKVLNGEDRLEKLTFKATHWLAQVQDLSKDKEIKKLMIKDMGIAKAMLRLMKNADLKELVEEDGEMHDLVVTVMKELAKRNKEAENEEASEAEEKDKEVGLVLEKLMEETMDEFKKLMRKDKCVAVAALHLMENHMVNLERLMEKDMEVADIIAKARMMSHGMDADNTSYHRNYCCRVFSYNYFSDRHDTSKAATVMLNKIKDIIHDKPGNQDLTRPMRRAEMIGIPTNFVGLESRKKRLLEIIKALASNDVQAVGIFGMGGSGKTTLAQEIVNSKANGIFHTTIMVEISESPNIEYIQDQIANGFGLADWHNVHGISEKATLLYNKLKQGVKSERRKDDIHNSVLLVLDNIWKEIDLPRMGIPREYCKLLLTSREKDVCKAMNVHEANIYEVGLLNDDESKDLFQVQVQKKVDIGEYKPVADRLLKKCGGLPLCIVATANSLKGRELPFWRQFAEELEKPISCQITGARYETFSILKTSYEFMASEEKKIFFFTCLFIPCWFKYIR